MLLVEGADDKAVIIHLGKVVDRFPTFFASPRGSVEQVLDAVRQEIRASGRRAVGIVVDANDSLDNRWKAIAARLKNAGADVPGRPHADGVIIEETTRLPRIGVWVMPDNKSAGELEDFVYTMLPDRDPVWPKSVGYIEGIPKEFRKFKEKKKRRAELHAWLATRREPRQMGLAIEAKDLEIDGILAVKFVKWLRRLFGEMEYP